MDRNATREQLLVMAYVDGELAESARQEFGNRLCQEPGLMREVVELRALVALVGQIASANLERTEVHAKQPD